MSERIKSTRWFKEGKAAREAGYFDDACPYGAGSPKAVLWLEGYDAGVPPPAPVA